MYSLRNNILKMSTIDFMRDFCNKATVTESNQNKKGMFKIYGQPTYGSHPHLMKSPNEVTPLITKSELQSRRDKLMDSIYAYATKCYDKIKNHLIIIPAASKQYMSDKIPYVFRQNTDFLYLTGCQEPDCCVIISSTNTPGEQCTTLFTRDRDEHSELWDGPRTHSEDAQHVFGVDQSLPISELENFLQSYKKTYRNTLLWFDFTKPVPDNIQKIINDYLHSAVNKTAESPTSFIHRLRLYKSTAEIALMQKSSDIAAQAFVETIASSKPGVAENHLFAKIDYECRLRDAEFLAYPPVIAGGNRATTIHYINNNQIVNDYELVLMDAGCEYHGYASDITRTWPVNGKFSPQQKLIYEVVLDVQKELIDCCNKFPSLDSLFETMCYLLGKRLQEIGLVGIQPSANYLMKAAYQLCPHHVSHYLGMDIHDTPSISRNIKIEPGMIITVEPGIYITSKHKHIPKEFHGIGVRIEDDVLITINGPVVLSRKCPKQIDDLERIASRTQ